MTNTDTQDLSEMRQMIAAELDARQRAKPAPLGDNHPASRWTVADIVHGHGIAKSSDHRPVANLVEVTDGSPLAVALEQARREALDAARQDRSARRKAVARARAARKAQLDALASSAVIPSQERLSSAWGVVAPMSEIVRKVAGSKKGWAQRFLGSNADDIGIMAIEQMVLVLAKSDEDLDLLARAAHQLGETAVATKRLPYGDLVSDAERGDAKKLAKARKWLMGMANNRVMGALVDSYTTIYNLRWDNIDLIATVMASISGVGSDPLLSHSKADRAPAMPVKSRRPGVIDPEILVRALSAAITDRRLDRLTELMLDQDCVRSDGSFMWTECAEAVFLADPSGDGAWKWDLVCGATAHIDESYRLRSRGDAAREFVRSQFAWLPGFITELVHLCDDHGGLPPQYRSIDALGEKRSPVIPALRYQDAAEAAAMLVRVLGADVTGEDIARSIAFA